MKNFVEIGTLFIFICFLVSVSTENGSKVPSTSRLQMREDRQLIRRSHSRNEFQELRNELRELRNLIYLMNVKINTNLGLVAENARRCPRLAIKARRIGNKCFSIGLIAKSQAAASTACAQQGGHLAEPDLTAIGLQDFVNGLQQRFPTEFAKLTGGKLWLNGEAEGDVILQPSSGVEFLKTSVPISSRRARSPPGTSVLFDPFNNLITLYDGDQLKPYVCEFDLV